MADEAHDANETVEADKLANEIKANKAKATEANEAIVADEAADTTGAT